MDDDAAPAALRLIDGLGPLRPERRKATMSYALISERAHKALKRYRCIWCGEQIPVGTRYVREFSVYDGDVQKHTWHPECKGAAEEFFRESGEDEFAPWENERPLSHAEQEFQSWDCSLLAQGMLALRA